jgi:uncharacterized protein YjdB
MKKIFLLFFLMSISLGYSQTTQHASQYFMVLGLVSLLVVAKVNLSKYFNRFVLPVIAIMLSTSMSAADYCAVARSSTNHEGSYTLNYTCRNVVGTTYEMKLEFANVTSGNANANIWANPGGVNVAANPVWSNGNQTLTYQFTTVSNPTLYVATVFVMINGVEVRWDLPIDANFAAVCSSNGGGGLPSPTIEPWSIPSKVLGDADFTITEPVSNSLGAFSYTSSNLAVATISGNTIHIVGAGTSTITANQEASDTYSAGSTTASFVVSVASTTPLAGPASPPVRNSWDVLSQYGSAYTNQLDVIFNDFSGSTIVGDVELDDNSVVKKYINHSYSGISPNNAGGGNDGGGNLDVSQMTHLHIDVWSPDFESFRVKLEGSNGSNRELEVPFTKVKGVWNSYDIPLNTYTSGPNGVNLTNLKWIVPVTFNPNNTTLYITNVYFYRAATTQPPSLGAFSVPAKLVGDADFEITPPTSTSNGAWSYSSSNANVATIVNGNMIHIVGSGNSTITATQAADGSYGAVSISAELVVSTPPLTVAAPTPPVRVETDVLSIYSDAYTPFPGTRNYNPNWGQSGTVSQEAVGTDNILKYSNFNYQGTLIGSDVDASEMTYLHVDIWSPNETSLQFFLVSTVSGERFVALTPLVQNAWNSYDIPLSSFTNQAGFSAGTSSIKEFKLVGSGGKTVYVDNMYFWRPDASLIEPTIANFEDIEKFVGDAAFTLTQPESDSDGAFSYTSSNPSVATISGNTVTIVGAGTATITATQAETATYASGFVTAQLTVLVPPLSVAAPNPPARNSWDVISLYSDAYATQSSPIWQNAATTTDELLEENNTKKMSNFVVELINFSGTDVSQMTTLHMDIYSEDCTGLNIWLNSNGDRRAQVSVALNGWNSIEIPLSVYSDQGLNMSGINLLKFESLNGGGKTVYVDNIYFYRPATLQVPTITDFNVPTKALGDASFSLTAPISNSSGAFTYTSSDENVATINGDVVTITGTGTTTITAVQAADGDFDSGSISAQFQVTVPIVPVSITSPSCGSTLSYRNAQIASNAVSIPGHTVQYRFRIENENVNATVTRDVPNFTILQASYAAYIHPAAATYNVYVALVVDGELQPESAACSITVAAIAAPGQSLSNCDTHLPSVSSITFAQSVSGAVRYQFKINGEELPSGPNAYFHFSNVYSKWNYGTTYTVEARSSQDGINFGGYSAPCDLTTPSIPTPSQGLTNCNLVMSSPTQIIYAPSVFGATGYEFEISIGGSIVEIISRPANYFLLSNIANWNYNTTYGVRTRAIRSTIDDVVRTSEWSTPCTVTSPSIPTPLQGLVNCSTVMTSAGSLLTTATIFGATDYLFEVTTPDGLLSIEKQVPYFRLSDVEGWISGTTYGVRVYAIRNSVVSEVSPTTCTFTTPGAAPSSLVARMAQVPFAVKAYPNPYSDGFQLNVVSSYDKTATVSVKVYDMLGRLVDSKNTTTSDLETTTIGSEYPSGVYNVIVTQENETKTVRVVKR